MDDSAVRLLARLKRGDALFVMHVNADADCVGSAFALHEAFGGTVVASAGVSKEGQRLADRLGFTFDLIPHPEKHSVVVAVDTSSRSQLGSVGARFDAFCLVDHHRYGDLLGAAPAAAWDAARPSCAEVVWDFIQAAGHQPTPQAALALLAALVSDTARFRHADAHSLRTAANLIELSGTSIADAERILTTEDDEVVDDPSARIAMLRALQRTLVEQHGSFLVATSHVRAHDAAAASALVRAGADVAVVVSERTQRARMSLRASQRAIDAGIHLGEVANMAARATGWSGGGHEGAAGLAGMPPAAPPLVEVVRLVSETLGAAQ